MPAVPGETVLTTLFADVHYYFNSPTSRPLHHRFARGSYLYLYQNPSTQRCRLEVANHAGTPEQDSFAGDLDTSFAAATYSHKQPTLFTLNVDRASSQDQMQWHINSFDERNDQKRLYKIHSLDIYLFTEKDAAIFLHHLSSLIPSERLTIRDAPKTKSAAPSEHRDSMSPVVQRLEQGAISTPRTNSVASRNSSLPGPPTPASSPPVTAPAPMAYNPAAPPAPEPIAHREKTPPPPDGDNGTGLRLQGNANPAYPTQSFFPGPPQQNMSFPGPPPNPALQRTPSNNLPPPPPGGPSPHQYAPSFQGPTGQVSSPPQHQPTPSFGPGAPPTPGFQQSTPGTYGLHKPLQSPGLPPPPPQPSQAPTSHQPTMVAGYSNYTYTADANAAAYTTAGAGGGFNGDVHSQVYRPTQAEAVHGKAKPGDPNVAEAAPTPMEKRFAKMKEKAKKFDKTWL